MKKQLFLHEAAVISFILLLLSVTACKDDTLASGGLDDPVPEGYVRLTATLGLEGMTTVQTRAVDPDVNGVENLRLYCFDENGLFITTVSTTFTPDDPVDPNTDPYEKDENGYILRGGFQANVPDYTHTVHIVANQSTDAFRDTDYLGQTEKNVMTGLTASSATMVYWGRVEAGVYMEGTEIEGNPAEETLAEAFDRIMGRVDKPYVELVRNQARVRFVKEPTAESGTTYGFSNEGFYVCNTNAFGTIAPYNAETGQFDWVTSPTNRNYITLPANPVRASIPNDVYTLDSRPQQYVFETENTLTDPVSVVVKGYNAAEDGGSEENPQYYRILLQDDESFTPLLIKRNHSYDIHITGPLTPGYATLQEALNGTPVNNVLLTVSDEITALNGPNYTLSVEQTSYVLTPGSNEWADNNTFSFTYTFIPADPKADKNEIIETENVTVEWTGEQNVAAAFVNTMNKDTENDILTGTVTLDLLPLGEDSYHEGTLMIHAKRLIRRVKIITVKKQSFVPSWVSSYVWPGNAGESFTLMFTIPDDTPAELFPFDVMVTAPEMDVRSESGMRLDVVTKVSDPDRYGEDIYYKADCEADGTPKDGVEPIGYKFVVPVTAPGRQRIYFKTTITDPTPDRVTIENPYFETMQLPFTFSGEDDERDIVFVTRTGDETKDSENGRLKDGLLNVYGQTANYEGIKYIVVPRKKNADVDFRFKITKYSADGSEDIGIDEKDEFILFTTFLDRDIADEDLIVNKHFEFLSKPGESSTSGRFWGFWPAPSSGSVDNHTEHTVYMKTNSPNSEGVVILRSNSKNAPNGSIKEGGTAYKGNNYRSASFELRNYRAFQFNAQVKPQEIGDDESWAGSTQSWTYEPGQKVDISFDVTSFLADYETTYGIQEEVDPFGTEFKVYIDAPMIKIDETRRGSLTEDKFYRESDGRFVYVVDANRSREATAATAWSKATHYWTTATYPGGGNPTERKTLPFITNSISSIGTITISAQSDIVDFDEETWTVVDKPITGTILFGETETTATNVVPKGAFVSFERTRDNTRIGSLTIDDDGKFSLSLRTEYTYDWGGTEYLALYYQGTDGNIYALPSGTRMRLQDLFEDYYQKNVPVKLVKVNP